MKIKTSKIHSQRARYGLSLALGTILLLASIVLASSGGPYDLSWWTVDGGGYTFSTGGNYTLGGTIGQPDAGVPQTGGDFSLQGGFWQCIPLDATADNATTNPDNDIRFQWSGGARNIYRAVDDPYSGSGSLIGDNVNSGWEYAETLYGNPASNAYYAVGNAADSACRDILGEFDFALVPGS